MITLLFQDNVGGLQAFDDDLGSWIDVNPLKDGIVLNIGDMMEIFSDGVFPAALHKVVAAPVERQSIAFFGHFDNKALIVPRESRFERHPRNANKIFKPMFTCDHVEQRRFQSNAYNN